MLTETLAFAIATAGLLNAWQTNAANVAVSSTASSTTRRATTLSLPISTTPVPTTSGFQGMTTSPRITVTLTMRAQAPALASTSPAGSSRSTTSSSRVHSITTAAAQQSTKTSTGGVGNTTVAAAAQTQQLTIVLGSVLAGLITVLTLIVIIVVLVRKGRCTSCCRRDQHKRIHRKSSSRSDAGINHEPIAAADAIYGVGLIELDRGLPSQPPAAGASLAIDNVEYMQTSRLLSLSDDGDVECVSKEAAPAIDRFVKPYACTSLLSQPAHHKEEAANGGRRTDDTTPYYSLPPLLEELPSPHSSTIAATAANHPAAIASCTVKLPQVVPDGASDGAGYAEPLVDRPESVYFVVDAVKR